MPDDAMDCSCDVKIPNREGMHARPVMRFVDVASKYKASITVQNTSRNSETVDGKSAMQMMLLEATQGSVLKITASGEDAQAAVDSLRSLVESGFETNPSPDQAPPDASA